VEACVEVAHRDRYIGRYAEHRLDPGRPEEPIVADVDVPQPDVGRLDREAQLLLAALEAIFRPAALLDVDDRTDMAEKRAIGPEPGASGIDRPAIAAVMMPQPVFDPYRAARRIGLKEDALRRFTIVGVGRIQPAEPKRLRLALSGEL
jgi:hypothetical protein